MATYSEGDVIVLKAGSFALLNGKSLAQIETDLECVVEGSNTFEPGSEDDHFTAGEMVRCRKLAGGTYDKAQPLYTFAASGDFDQKYIQPQLTVVRKMRKTFVPLVDGVKPGTEVKEQPAPTPEPAPTPAPEPVAPAAAQPTAKPAATAAKK